MNLFEVLVALVVLYFVGLFAVSFVVARFNPIIGLAILKKGTFLFLKVSRKIIRFTYKWGVRIALFLWEKTNQYVLPKAKKLSLQTFKTLQNKINRKGVL